MRRAVAVEWREAFAAVEYEAAWQLYIEEWGRPAGGAAPDERRRFLERYSHSQMRIKRAPANAPLEDIQQPRRVRYSAAMLRALEERRKTLAAAGTPQSDPRLIRLCRLIAKIQASLGQLDLWDW